MLALVMMYRDRCRGKEAQVPATHITSEALKVFQSSDHSIDSCEKPRRAIHP